MLRRLIVLAALTILAGQAGAHFLFVHVVQGEEPRVEVHFAESGWEFSADQRMVGIMGGIKGWTPEDGVMVFEPRPHAMVAAMPADGTTACATFTYGMMRRGAEFLLTYHAKGVSGLEAAASPAGLDVEVIADREGDELVLTVLFRGKPAPGAEIVVPLEGTRIEIMSTDVTGQVRIPLPRTPLFSIRAMVAERKNGVHDGEEYEEVRHYTTLTVHPAGTTGGDGLASALLADARGAAAAFSADAPEWRGRLQGRFDDEEIRGSIANDDGGTKVSFASSAPEAARSSLAMLEALDDAGQESLAGARFNSPRVASLDASITIPESGQTFLVRNRRIESVLTSGESGSRRVDVLEWESTEDQRHLPTRVLVTEFDATGAIKGVAILKTEFSLQNGVQVPTSHSGTMIDGPSAASLFSLQVNDVAIKDS